MKNTAPSYNVSDVFHCFTYASKLFKSKSSKLYIFYGKPKNVVQYIINQIKNKFKNICLGLNQDFTKYSLERDKLIEEICKKNSIDYLFNLFHLIKF